MPSIATAIPSPSIGTTRRSTRRSSRRCKSWHAPSSLPTERRLERVAKAAKSGERRTVAEAAWLEQLIAANLPSLFPDMRIGSHYAFRVMRNADLSLEDAEAVLADMRLEEPVLQTIAALVQRSLLVADTRHDEARYSYLEPIRQFAAEQLRRRPTEQHRARSAHLHRLAEVAEAAEEPVLFGPDLLWRARLEAELPNIRGALAWGFDEQRQDASRLAAALIWFCVVRGLHREGAVWAEKAMASGGRLRARAAHMRGLLLTQLGEHDEAERCLLEAEAILRRGRWASDLVTVLYDLAQLAYHIGDVPSMRRWGEDALTLAEAAGRATGGGSLSLSSIFSGHVQLEY